MRNIHFQDIFWTNCCILQAPTNTDEPRTWSHLFLHVFINLGDIKIFQFQTGKCYTNSNRQLDQRIPTEAWNKHAKPEIETVINLCSDSFDWVQTGKDLGLGLQAHCKNRSKYMKPCHAIVIKEEKLETASLQQALSSPSHSIPKCSWRSDFYLCLSQLCDQSIHLSSSALSPTWMNKYTRSKMTARFPDESHEIVPAGGRQGGVVCLSVYWGTVH